MKNKKVLIVGSGGREHALGWKLAQSPSVDKIFFVPGHAGTNQLGTNISLDIKNHAQIIDFVKKYSIDLVVVAPDDPLADGMVDSLTKVGICAFGPIKNAARLEWSKSFAKKLMKEENIPTAKFESFEDFQKALRYIKTQEFPLVVKASGLALGKGVVICQSESEAEEALRDIMIKRIYGEAGSSVVIEEYLVGHEVSFHVFCDGEHISLFPTSKDHKTIFDNNQGPNTGGMGTIAPVPWISESLVQEVKDTIIIPILAGLKKRGIIYKGILYPGIMITKDGPKALEFNSRFGDPETQSYMRILDTDLYAIMMACIDGTLDRIRISWAKKYACCLILASAGYPASSTKGIPISGLQNAEKIKDVTVFHSATKIIGDDCVTNGGRVLGVTAVGETLEKSLKKAYKAVELISFDNMQYRKDIGKQ